VRAKPGILLVDHNARNVELLSSFLREAGYRTEPVSTLDELDRVLDAIRTADVALALVDLTGFESSVWDRCRRLHEAGIAFVVIARQNVSPAGRDLFRQSHGAGAAHVLTKPLRKEQLLTLVRILTGADD
jgi:CheY-like chemotaxis protein